jgi:uncharacterized protein (DUF302 family)
MSYHFSAVIKDINFDEAIDKVTAALKVEGFGVLTEIDIKATMKAKLDVDYRPYKILGACNPGFAHKALQAEARIGTMLPCNVIVRQLEDDSIEVSAVDPIASMQGVGNESLGGIATEVQGKLKAVIDSL